MGTRKAKAAAVGATRPQEKPKAAVAPRIAGVRQTKPKPLSLYELSESDELPVMTAVQRKKMLAWRDRVERLAVEDPEAYAEACRSGKQL
jgi:hypothetical protein